MQQTSIIHIDIQARPYDEENKEVDMNENANNDWD